MKDEEGGKSENNKSGLCTNEVNGEKQLEEVLLV